MDFTFNEDQQLLRDSTRRFLEKQHPLDALRPLLEAPEVVDRAVWQHGAELGWTSMMVPEANGGGSVTDQPLVDLMVIGEELGRVLYPGPFVPTNVVADAIARNGSPEQRVDVLPGIITGEIIAAWCSPSVGTTESASVGVDVTQVADGVRLDGVARYVHGGSVADIFLVAARTESGVCHVLVSASNVGVSIRCLEGLDLTRRLAEITFAGVLLPNSAIVVAEGSVGRCTYRESLRSSDRPSIG